MKSRLLLLVAMSLLLCGQGLCAQAAPASPPAQLGQWVRDLGSPTPEVRQAAVIALTELPPADLGALEAAATRKDLSPESARHLNLIIANDKQWLPARLRIRKALESDAEVNLRTTLDDYDHFGHKDARWDDTVHKAIAQVVALGHREPIALPALEQAINAGCDDPLVLYLRALELGLTPNPDPQKLNALSLSAARAMAKSNYPPFRKCLAAHRYWKTETTYLKTHPVVISAEVARDLKEMSDLAFDQWPAATTSTEFPRLRVRVVEMFPPMMETLPPEKDDAAFNYLYGPLEKALPNSADVIASEGHYYILAAWKVRGSGWAKDVKPQAWPLFSARLAKAEELLTKAWTLDPTNRMAAVDMIKVALGRQQPRDVMELWFKRAMEADPDDANNLACDAKMLFLHPKWYGSAADLLAFGHECYDREDWAGDTEMQLIRVHDGLSTYAPDKDAYYENEAVWKDVESVYLPYLRIHPGNANVRSHYAWLASRSKRWTIARQQFNLLGANAVPAVFGGAEAMNAFKAQAELKGTGAAGRP